MRERLGIYEGSAARILKVETKTLWAYNTYQFSDYSKYESSIFNEPEKAAYRKEIFPKQCPFIISQKQGKNTRFSFRIRY